jgi:hypothetical protein
MIENIIADLPMLIDKQLGMITFCYREFRNTLIWKLIVIFAYTYLFCIHVIE